MSGIQTRSPRKAPGNGECIMASLAQAGALDELRLMVNPVAIVVEVRRSTPSRVGSRSSFATSSGSVRATSC